MLKTPHSTHNPWKSARHWACGRQPSPAGLRKIRRASRNPNQATPGGERYALLTAVGNYEVVLGVSVCMGRMLQNALVLLVVLASCDGLAQASSYPQTLSTGNNRSQSKADLEPVFTGTGEGQKTAKAQSPSSATLPVGLSSRVHSGPLRIELPHWLNFLLSEQPLIPILASETALPPTTCIDPNLHFTVRELRGRVLDEKGNGEAHVKGDLYRLHKTGRTDEGGPYFEPAPNVFRTFETDEQGVFGIPHLPSGLYRVVVRPPRLYMAVPVVVKVDRHGAPEGLVAKLVLTGNCGAWWNLEDTSLHSSTKEIGGHESRGRVHRRGDCRNISIALKAPESGRHWAGSRQY